MNHFSYPLTIVQISIFEEPQNIFSNQNLRPQTIEPALPRIFNYRVPPPGTTAISFQQNRLFIALLRIGRAEKKARPFSQRV